MSEHGTVYRYRRGCKCAECKEAAAEYMRQWRKANNGLPDGDPRHGTTTGYNDWNCRCEACTEAKRDSSKRWPKSQRTPSGRGTVTPHGAHSRYNAGCRCRVCTDAENLYQRSRRVGGLADDDKRHGTLTAYAGWGCRCEPCRKAGRDYRQSVKGGAA